MSNYYLLVRIEFSAAQSDIAMWVFVLQHHNKCCFRTLFAFYQSHFYVIAF